MLKLYTYSPVKSKKIKNQEWKILRSKLLNPSLENDLFIEKKKYFDSDMFPSPVLTIKSIHPLQEGYWGGVLEET